MRTWLHALPRRHHAEAASFRRKTRGAQTKRRVGVPDPSGPPRARRRAGFREQIGARRTVAPLAERALDGKRRVTSVRSDRAKSLLRAMGHPAEPALAT